MIYLMDLELVDQEVERMYGAYDFETELDCGW